MDTWTKTATGIRRVLTLIGTGLILLISFGITAEVLLRKLLNISLGGVDELSAYAFAIFTSFAFVIATLDKANIRIDILRSVLPRKARIGMDLLAQATLIAFVAFLDYRAFLLVQNSWEKGSRAITPLATPLAWPQTIWLLGLIFFLTVLLVMFALSCRALIRRDPAAFYRFASPSHEVDEIENLPAGKAIEPTLSKMES